MAEKLNKVALFIVLLVVIALIFGQLGFQPQTAGGNAQASIKVTQPIQPESGARASIRVLTSGEKTAPVFYGPLGSGYAVLTVLPSR